MRLGGVGRLAVSVAGGNAQAGRSPHSRIPDLRRFGGTPRTGHTRWTVPPGDVPGPDGGAGSSVSASDAALTVRADCASSPASARGMMDGGAERPSVHGDGVVHDGCATGMMREIRGRSPLAARSDSTPSSSRCPFGAAPSESTAVRPHTAHRARYPGRRRQPRQ